MSLAVSHADASVVYAGTIGPLFNSTDGGVTFGDIGPAGVFKARAVAVDPGNASTLFWVLTDGVYKSANGGVSFTKLGLSIPVWSGSTDTDSSIAIDPSDTRSVYVAVSAQLWHTPDGGATWSAVNLGVSDERISGFVANPLAPDRIFAVRFTGEFISVGGGQHFEAMTTLPARLPVTPQAFAIDPSRAQIT
jgi:photosystem II stability/assembly factor-like uncharacterized protein